MKHSTLKPLNYPAAIDIGSEAVRVCVADRHADGSLHLQGVGEAASAGITEGMITDIEKASESIRAAVRHAEYTSGYAITQVLPAISGEHITGGAGDGSAVISDNSVSASDIAKVREMAGTTIAHSNRRLLATLDRDYEIDGQAGIRQPLDMTGRKLSGTMHLVAADVRALENFEKCINNAGVELTGQFVFAGLAAARAVLTEDEKKLGVCLVDLGAETTEITIYANGNVYVTEVLAAASNYIHHDVAHVHRASLKDAKRVKHDIGIDEAFQEAVALSDVGDGNEMTIDAVIVRDTMLCRAREIFKQIAESVEHFQDESGQKLSAGLVLVGDGSLLPGLSGYISRELQMGVRIARPRYRGEHYEAVAHPRFAVALGLLMHAVDNPPLKQQWGLASMLKKFKNLLTIE